MHILVVLRCSRVCLAIRQQVLTSVVHTGVQIPIGAEDRFEGVVDLVRMKGITWDGEVGPFLQTLFTLCLFV